MVSQSKDFSPFLLYLNVVKTVSVNFSVQNTIVHCTDHAQKGVRRVFLRYVRLGVTAGSFFYFWVKKIKPHPKMRPMLFSSLKNSL